MKLARFAIVLIEIVICYLLENVISVTLPFSKVYPDLLMVVVVGISWMFGSNKGMLYGFLAGLLLDVTNGTQLGYSAIIFVLIGYVAGYFRKFYRKDNNVLPLLLIAVGEFFYLSVFYVMNFLTRGRDSYKLLLSNMILPRITLTVLIAVFLYKLLQVSINWSRSGDE